MYICVSTSLKFLGYLLFKDDEHIHREPTQTNRDYWGPPRAIGDYRGLLVPIGLGGLCLGRL